MDELDEILSRIQSERGGVADIFSAFSAFPVGIEAHFDFYSALMLGDSLIRPQGLPLPRAEREWLAVATSRANECDYCVAHHEEAFSSHPSDESNNSKTRLTALTELARTLTQDPKRSALLRERFRGAGFSEAEWQHAVMIVAYFNFSNRCALAMGLKVEPDYAKTCH